MGDIFLSALALMLVMEGLLPFLAPGFWRATFIRLAELSDDQVRIVGLGSMMAGLLLLFVAH